MPNSALARSNAKSIPSLIEQFSSETIGPLEDTKAAILELFPDIRWREQHERYMLCGVILNIVFGFGADRDVVLQRIGEGDVLFLSVRSLNKRDITLVQEKLNLRIIDKRFGPVR